MTTSPRGRTAHYEKIDGKWFVVWSADFAGDKSGMREVNETEAFLLERGFFNERLPAKDDLSDLTPNEREDYEIMTGKTDD